MTENPAEDKACRFHLCFFEASFSEYYHEENKSTNGAETEMAYHLQKSFQ